MRGCTLSIICGLYPLDASSAVFPVKKIKNISRDFPSLAVQWLRLCLPMQGVQVRPLVGELRPPPCLGAKKNQSINQKQYCNRDFKMVPLTRKKLLKISPDIAECPLGRGVANAPLVENHQPPGGPGLTSGLTGLVCFLGEEEG